MKHVVHEVVLDNGARGLFIDIPDASVITYEFNFRAGEYLVAREKWETPHLMEHLVLKSNELYPKARLFQAEIEKNGAYSNASTGPYEISYEAECADFEWDRILGLLLVAMSKPLFTDEDFEAEFGNVREELASRANNHFRHLSLCLREAYGFYAVTDQERLQLMQNVTNQDVKVHHANTHTTSNLRFIVAGRLPAARRRQLKALISAIELPKGKGRIELPLELPQKLSKPLYVENETVDNLYFYVDTFMKRWMDDPEFDALKLANILLTETLHSRIFGEARERGIVYHVQSNYWRSKGLSNWWIGAQVLPKNAEALFNLVVDELKLIQAGKISQQEIADAKQFALGAYQRSAQTVSGTAAGYGRYFFDETIEDYYKLPERIAGVTKKQVVNVMQSLFQEKLVNFGALGSCGEQFLEKISARLSF